MLLLLISVKRHKSFLFPDVGPELSLDEQEELDPLEKARIVEPEIVFIVDGGDPKGEDSLQSRKSLPIELLKKLLVPLTKPIVPPKSSRLSLSSLMPLRLLLPSMGILVGVELKGVSENTESSSVSREEHLESGSLGREPKEQPDRLRPELLKGRP